MNADESTINNDIQLLFREFRKSEEGISFERLFAKQMARLESQRSRLMSYLEKADNVEEKLAIEGTIADIVFRALAASFKVATGRLQFHDAVNQEINEIAKARKLTTGFLRFSKPRKYWPRAEKS